MDLSTQIVETPVDPPEGEARSKKASDRMFRARGPTEEPPPGMITSSPAIVKRIRGRSSWAQPAPILAAAGAIGLLAYGALRLTSPDRGSITQELPPPSASGVATISLPPPNLLRPLSPEEATKENSERPFVNRPDTAATRFVLKTDGDDRTRALTCLAQAVYYEAASEGVDGGRAVAQVVLNRLHHPGYPSTVCGVVYEGADRLTGCQFSFTCDGSMLRVPVPALWNRSKEIAQQALDGRVFAPVGHATHYHADYVLPYWADSLDKTVQIGRHIFYRLRSTLGDSRSFFQRYAGTEPQVRQPGATVVIPPSDVPQQLTDALISDDANGSVKEVEKAAAQAATPLLVDASRGTLLADNQGAPAPAHRPKSSADCAVTDHKQLTALSVTDMRASAAPSAC